MEKAFIASVQSLAGFTHVHAADIVADNGVIQVIDSAVMPK